MRLRYFIFSTIFISLGVTASAQWFAPSEKNLRQHIATLASDEFRGREAQSEGDTLSVRYIVDYLSGLRGVKMLFDGGVQSFTAPVMTGEEISTFNVAAFIEGHDPELKNEVIVIGAHYDHVGTDDWADNQNSIKYGADDNASGVATLLELTRDMASHRKDMRRSVMVVFFGGEEKGLLGSGFFVKNMPKGIGQVVLMVNFDMLGRYTFERGLSIYGTGTFPEADSLINSVKLPLDGRFKVKLLSNVDAASDHRPFAKAGYPVLCFNTGIHSDYHKNSDRTDKINFMGLNLIYGYISDIVYTLTNADKF